MHEPAGVVEILVQILQNTPILKYSFRIPPPETENCQRFWHFDFSVSEYPPSPPKLKIVRDFGTLTFQFQNTPPKLKIVRYFGILTFQFQNTPLPPKLKIVRYFGTLTFQFQNTPSPETENCQRFWHFDFSVSEYPLP